MKTRERTNISIHIIIFKWRRYFEKLHKYVQNNLYSACLIIRCPEFQNNYMHFSWNLFFSPRDFIIFSTIIYYSLSQYTDWENLSDKYLNQKVLGDLVGDYFFVCPTNIFANVFAEKGGKVYYYYFTQVRRIFSINKIILLRLENDSQVS